MGEKYRIVEREDIGCRDEGIFWWEIERKQGILGMWEPQFIEGKRFETSDKYEVEAYKHLLETRSTPISKEDIKYIADTLRPSEK